MKPHPSLSHLYSANKMLELQFSPVEVPMLCPPLPWLSTRTGAYILRSTGLVRVRAPTSFYPHPSQGCSQMRGGIPPLPPPSLAPLKGRWGRREAQKNNSNEKILLIKDNIVKYGSIVGVFSYFEDFIYYKSGIYKSIFNAEKLGVIYLKVLINLILDVWMGNNCKRREILVN